MDKSIFYVDIENLQDIAQTAIIEAIEHWPGEFPKPAMLKLYVKADQTELWKIWANHNIREVEVLVKGIQHYTLAGSKNSADISLALEALSDLLKNRTRHIAVMSDDSDYVTLFMALKQELEENENPDTLFKWFMTNRPDTHSQILNYFFPSEYIHIVDCLDVSVKASEYNQKGDSINSTPTITYTDEEQIALTLINNIPVGTFKSSDCKKIIKQYFPKHDLNHNDSATYGTQFVKIIWPLLEKHGVKSEKSSRGPRKYEMTQESKDKIKK